MCDLTLWCFLKNRSNNIIHEWADDRRLSKRDRAMLNQKLDRLQQIDYSLARQTKLLDGPIQKSGHIYKLVVHGDVMMRPTLCRGPINNEAEYTLLLGAIEKDRKLDPHDCVERASIHRTEVMNDAKWRGRHQRVPSKADS